MKLYKKIVYLLDGAKSSQEKCQECIYWCEGGYREYISTVESMSSWVLFPPGGSSCLYSFITCKPRVKDSWGRLGMGGREGDNSTVRMSSNATFPTFQTVYNNVLKGSVFSPHAIEQADLKRLLAIVRVILPNFTLINFISLPVLWVFSTL